VFKPEQCTHKSFDYGYNVIEYANFPKIIQTENLSKNGTYYAQPVFVFVETTNKTRHTEVNKEL
jgi:hypothetical protein